MKTGVIVIVDDSEMVRNFHSYVLRNAGYKVLTAVDGAEALEKIYSQSEPPLAVITDINMPGMDGYTFIERLREDAFFDAVPIIIVSTEEEWEDRTRGFAAGADAYLVKPTNPARLLSYVQMLTEDRRKGGFEE